MLRSIKTKLRQLWQQCDLFDALPVETAVAPAPPPRQRPTAPPVPPVPPPTLQPPSRPATTPPRTPRTQARDRVFVERLTEAYRTYNEELFQNALRPVKIRVSRRMKNRLGHYMTATRGGLPAEIAISLRHIRRDSWDEVLHTLVHEMVHQWQDESGLPIDHGRHFRAKAREVGIHARATRRVA